MEKRKRYQKKVCSIRIQPYLAEYCQKKFDKNPHNGGIVIPSWSDLYFCVWNNMRKAPLDAPSTDDANLLIDLPTRRSGCDDYPSKDPSYYNHLSAHGVKRVEECIRMMFNFEFHAFMMDNENHGRTVKHSEMVDRFIRQYCLKSISTDALLKNFYRYRNLIHPRKKRKYTHKDGGKRFNNVKSSAG